MASKISPFSGKLFDGRTAGKVSVAVRPTPSGLVITFPDNQERSWIYSSLRLSDSGGTKGPVRVEHDVKEGGAVRVETLVVSDSSFLVRVEDIAPNALGSLWEQPRHKRLTRLLLALAAAVIPLFLFLVWKIGVPAAADIFVPTIPVSWEEKLGEQAYASMFGEKPAAPDPQIQKALDEISGRLLAPVEDQPYNFRVYIHPDKTFNAMAFPGGLVVVFQGLLDHTDNPEELAGVLAHEFQHVLQRHPTRNLVRQIALSVILALIVGDTGDVMGLILEMAGQLGGLSYTREMEAEADEKGMKMALAAGVDPKGMISIFEKLTRQGDLKIFATDKNKSPGAKNEGEGDGKVDEDQGLQEWMKYLSTHPLGKNRIKMLNKLAAENSGTPIKPLLPGIDWGIMRSAPRANKTEGSPGQKT